jgi:hypothetical protein
MVTVNEQAVDPPPPITRRTHIMNKRIRTGLVATAIAGGTIFGASQLGGVANAQVDDAPTTDEQSSEDRAARHEARRAHRMAHAEEIATLLGIDVESLHDALRDGSTLAELADFNGVEVDAVVDLLVGSHTEHIEQAVENGRITQENADERLSDLEERVTDRVNNGRPERPERPEGQGPAAGFRGGPQA